MPDAPLQSSLFEEDYLLRELDPVALTELDLSRVPLPVEGATEGTENLNHEKHESMAGVVT